MVRDIEPDDKNPFTTKQTVSMIKKYHLSKGDDVEVMIIPDIESVNYGRGVGYDVCEIEVSSNIANISATDIRNQILNNQEDWKSLVDDKIHEYLKELLLK